MSKQSDSAFFPTSDDPLGSRHAADKLKALEERQAVSTYLLLFASKETRAAAVLYSQHLINHLGRRRFLSIVEEVNTDASTLVEMSKGRKFQNEVGLAEASEG